MEPYATAATADSFACSISAFEALTRTLSGPDAAGWDHYALEEHLEAAGRELLRHLLQDHLDLRALHEEEQVRDGAHPIVVGPDDELRPWRETGHARLLACLFGTLRVTRVAHRGRGPANVHPADAVLSLPTGRHSLGFRRLAVVEAVRGSFDQAHAAVERRCGRVLGKRRLAELVVAAAVNVDAFYRSLVPRPVQPGHAADPPSRRQGGGDAARRVARGHPPRGGEDRGGRKARPTRPGRETQPQADGHGGLRLRHPARTTPPARHHPPVGGRSGDREPRPRPKAERKWCTASLVRTPEQVVAGAFDQAVARDPGHLRPWVVLVDGARHQLDLIHAEADRRGVRVHVLLDFVHVAEYVWAATHAFHKPGTDQAEAFAADHLTAILADHAARTAAEMTAQAERQRLPATQREAVDACHRYLTGHLDQRGYGTALEAGWPIATGAVEGACRHLIADRLDITGARWGLDSAEAVLRLRTVVANGDDETYWRFHTNREHQRLYPSPHQQAYDLTA